MPANVAQGLQSALVALLCLPRLSLGNLVRSCPDPACSGHGHCLGEACECEAHWAGVACENNIYQPGVDLRPDHPAAPPPEECPSACSNHGSCEVSLCHCDAGWTGADCATEAQCPENCNTPSGRCVGGQCLCADGFHGKTCAERTCANGCWGHGACQDGRCACGAGWTGDQCEVSNPTALAQTDATQTDAVSVLQQHLEPKEARIPNLLTSMKSGATNFVQKIAEAKHAAERAIAAASSLS